MKASRLNSTLTALIEQKVPAFLWGAPGIGKSSIVKQIAQSNEIDFIDLRLALMDPTDLKGIPFYDKESHTALWAPPAFLPKSGEGILFLDELNTAAPSVQASAYQLILDRRVGEYVLPDGWAIVAAGNRESDRGVTYRMPSPLANRFVHFEMEVDVEFDEVPYMKNPLTGTLGYETTGHFGVDVISVHNIQVYSPRRDEMIFPNKKLQLAMEFHILRTYHTKLTSKAEDVIKERLSVDPREE